MHIRKILLTAALGVFTLAGPVQTFGALGTLALEFDAKNFDVPNYRLPDSVNPGTYALQPRNETPSNPLFALPIYFSNGAGPGNRAYVGFVGPAGPGNGYGNMYAASGFSTPTASILNTAGTAQGYTLDAYFRFDSDFVNGNNGEIGAATFARNSFIAKNAAYDGQDSFTTVWADGTPTVTRTDISANISLNAQWVHLVKTHELTPTESITKWYINGAIVPGATVITPFTPGALNDYKSGALVNNVQSGGPWNGGPDDLGAVGMFSRDFNGFSYSYFRAFRGAATSEEVYFTLLGNALLPEPTSALSLLAIIPLLARQRRRR